MTGPPLAIRVEAGAQPAVTNHPVRVPVYWREEGCQQLERDEALGVIKKVPPNTLVTWLHSMVVTPKSDGSPCRTVDLQPLNRVSVRKKHRTVPPAKQAHSIPRNQVKTVMDMWNGYHSIPLHVQDQDKTTFLTEERRHRISRAPMGFVASGNAYTQRYDLIMAGIPRLTKCIDDALL